MAFKMIDPNAVKAKQDFHPVKMGFDAKGNVNISINQSTAKRIGLIVDGEEESPLAAVGIDGSVIGIQSAAEGQAGFELSKTKAEVPRYQFALPVSSLFEEEIAIEPFRARIMTSVKFADNSGAEMVTFDVAEHLFTLPVGIDDAEQASEASNLESQPEHEPESDPEPEPTQEPEPEQETETNEHLDSFSEDDTGISVF